MELVQIMKALADETRLRILNILRDGELCVCEIEHVLGINQSNASRHLNKLTGIKLISYYKKAQFVYYQINRKTLEQYPFAAELIDAELGRSEELSRDTERLKQCRTQGMCCESLKGENNTGSNF